MVWRSPITKKESQARVTMPTGRAVCRFHQQALLGTIFTLQPPSSSLASCSLDSWLLAFSRLWLTPLCLHHLLVLGETKTVFTVLLSVKTLSHRLPGPPFILSTYFSLNKRLLTLLHFKQCANPYKTKSQLWLFFLELYELRDDIPNLISSFVQLDFSNILWKFK